MKKAVLNLALVAVVGCGRPDVALRIPVLELGLPLGDVSLVREAAGAERGGADLYLPSRPTVAGSDVWVLDEGNDRLVRFDSALARARTYGRTGQGPGELEFAQDLVLDADRLLVVETGNGRISTFDTAGTFLATHVLTGPPRHLAIAGDEPVVTLLQTDGYGFRADAPGALEPWAIRPEPLERLARSDTAAYPRAGAFLAPGPNGGLVVLDPSVLALVVYDARGKVVSTRLLPEPFRTDLLRRRAAQTKAWGARASSFVDRPATKRISTTDDGSLLVLFPLERHWGLLIDPRTGVTHPLVLPSNPREREILRSASDARLTGERLLVTSGSALYELKLRRDPATPASLTRGPADAPHRIVVFADYQCAACALLEREAGSGLGAWVAERGLHLEIRHFPLPGHRRARTAAAAALCAEEQGAGWAMHAALFDTQPSWTGSAPITPWLGHLADSLGIDAPSLSACLGTERIARRIEDDLALGRALGLIGVPTILLDGRPVPFRSASDLLERVGSVSADPVSAHAIAQRIP